MQENNTLAHLEFCSTFQYPTLSQQFSPQLFLSVREEQPNALDPYGFATMPF